VAHRLDPDHVRATSRQRLGLTRESIAHFLERARSERLQQLPAGADVPGDHDGVRGIGCCRTGVFHPGLVKLEDTIL